MLYFYISLLVSAVAIIAVAGAYFAAYRQQNKAKALFKQAKRKLEAATRDAEIRRRDALSKLRDELYRKRNESRFEIKKERIELERVQNKLSLRSDNLSRNESALQDSKDNLQQLERNLLRRSDSLHADETKIKGLYNELIQKLENIVGMSRDDAKKALLQTLESEVKLTSQKWIQKVEEDTRKVAKEKAVGIVTTAMQRYTADSVAPHASGVVHLPSDDMKGRIIGKEGRNIKALEMATGMEFVIGDTPEIITISGFNPIRREVARRSLEKLVSDGRINPTRIEEIVKLTESDIDEIIQEYGTKTILEMNLQGLHPEMVTLLGRLHFRTSFSQNVLLHSKEVARFAGMIADELGLDGRKAMRAGLLHDIGKAVSAEVEGPHAIIGGDIAKRCGEEPLIINAIAAHHEEVPFESVYSVLVVIADTISACRPGARRETLAAYIKRLEKLEEIAYGFDGIKKAFALQAGREVRVIVEENFMNDDQAREMARNIAKKVETDMAFPGQIKVNVIRETRSIEYAR
ncbi:ribonuclease Y [bacterium]|jgi:ribonucrease Y|nr:ribonuclease Y [bacterium]MBT3904018.1 ribonuclease Y [bacterium]MBT4577443.1 ribonuclease Y [bacterium]MBT5345972.1 ribonuclease Y [bacterium]MBT6528752.1 ribonuclease Y [bacterium]